MKRKLLMLTLCAASLATAGCHKTCRCMAYNGSEHTYTADEVSEAGGTCHNMEYLYSDGTQGADVRYYAVCNWD